MKTVLTFILISIGAYVIPSLSLAATLNPPALKDTRQLNKQTFSPQQSGALSHQPAPAGNLKAQTNFLTGYEMYQSKNYQEACSYLYRYLSQQTPDDVDFEWAEFFFGISLKKMGNLTELRLIFWILC